MKDVHRLREQLEGRAGLEVPRGEPVERLEQRLRFGSEGQLTESVASGRTWKCRWHEGRPVSIEAEAGGVAARRLSRPWGFPPDSPASPQAVRAIPRIHRPRRARPRRCVAPLRALKYLPQSIHCTPQSRFPIRATAISSA